VVSVGEIVYCRATTWKPGLDGHGYEKGAFSRMHRTALALATTLMMSLGLATSASASVSCTSFDNRVLRLVAFDHNALYVQSGRILFYAEGMPGPCAAATTTNTDKIVVDNSGESWLYIDLGEPFAPGATDEGDGSSEIEINVVGNGFLLGINPGITGAPAPAMIGLGTAGINLNGGETAGIDPDLTVSSAHELVQVGGSDSKDVIDAAGGFGTGGDFGMEAHLAGGAGNDVLQAGAGVNELAGGDGNDQLHGGPGNDEILGGPGRDMVNLKHGAVGPITASLTTETATGAGSDVFRDIENLTGSVFGDTLTGDGQRNRLRGRRGDDQLFGLAGNDSLDGWLGFDTLTGGGGADSCVDGEQLFSC
jgi:Ca2+-binding RTX toxin-like protein